MKAEKRFGSLIAMTAWLAVGSVMVPPLAGAQQEIAPAKQASAPFAGEKKRIAVAKFDAVGAYAANFMGVDIGGGMAAQLTTALVESGRFVVVERATLGDIQREQQLGAQRQAPQEAVARAGGIIDAQMLIVGSVTEFEQAASGGGLNIGLSGPLAGIGFGGKTVEGHVGMDIRLVDTTTGQVVTSKRVEARVPESSVSFSVTKRGMEFGGDAFNKTPLGVATRKAIEDAVAIIVKEMETIQWAGRVADLLGDQVLVNAGRDMNLRPGTVLVVSSVVKEVTDPATGARLGVIEAPVGEIQIDQVQEKFSTARLLTGSLPKRGDLLRLKP